MGQHANDVKEPVSRRRPLRMAGYKPDDEPDELPPPEQKRVYVAFTRNLYDLLAELQRRHPKVEIESCSGGGGRVDLGILRYVDEVWPSDNTDPFDRLSQQDGFSYAYTPQVMMAWVTEMNKRVGVLINFNVERLKSEIKKLIV